jgi:glyoxylase-like metal-dependent hydrolase (beta-lactamase superfamily II)
MPGRHSDRRRFLQLLAAAAAGASFARHASAQSVLPGATPPGAFQIQLFGTERNNVHVIRGAGGNVVVTNDATGGDIGAFPGPTSLLVVNGGMSAHATSLLGMTAGGRTPIKYLFNTDWHPENTGLNLAVAESGGQILAHEFTKQYLSIDRPVEWQNTTYKPLPPKALPTRTFTRAGSMKVGDQTVEYGPLGQAHTDGDIYVFFRAPETNALVVGDIMTVGKYPIADYTSGGWLGGMITATKTLLDLAGPETTIIPGDGPLQTRADLQAQYDMLSASRDAFVKMMRQGMSADEMIAAGATKAFDARWGDPQLFVKTSYRGLWLHVREVGGIV